MTGTRIVTWRCGYCWRPIFLTVNGAWYHRYTGSVACHPGSGDHKQAFPGGAR